MHVRYLRAIYRRAYASQLRWRLFLRLICNLFDFGVPLVCFRGEGIGVVKDRP